MNKTNQLWSLIKFQVLSNPFVLLMPVLFFAMPMWILRSGRFGPDYHPSLDLVLTLSGQSFFFVGFIGVMLLAPDFFQFGGANPMYATGTEFLLTRAVDRRVVYRARIVLFYALILAIPLVTFMNALTNPDLHLSEYQKVSHQQILARIPGSVAAPAGKDGRSEKISIPQGNILVEGWNLAAYSVAVLMTQLVTLLLYPLKYRRPIIFTIYAACIAFPLRSIGHSAGMDKLPFNENLFLTFAPHPGAFLVLTALAMILVQLWSERRFARMEQ
jgi:hypothetical protein